MLIKFKIKYFGWNFYAIFHMTALHAAVEKGNLDIVNLLLQNDKLNVNILSILNNFDI